MKKKRLAVFLVVLWVLMSGIAWAVDLGMITGGRKGTYFQFGLNMMELSKQYGFNLSVYNSRGSVENVYAVYKRPRTQMGIVQSDVLAFVLKVKTDKTLKRIARKTKMIFPLYNEEIHLLGKEQLLSFDDLEGKRVAIGKEGSGTYLTSMLLFEVSGIKPGKTVPLGTEQALDQLKAGKIDAMFYVAGLPVKLFSESITGSEGLHLIPITNKSITEFYPMADIPANTYAWQGAPIHTVAVKAVLVSFDFRRNNCDHVGRFAGMVYDNLDWLKQNGHPKWKNVDLDYPLKGWSQYDCVKKYLHTVSGEEQMAPMEKNPLLKAIKEIL
ncbi:TAXI family TRAP transporter solute-binding subunit [Desulfospira joergensenii]|uniref:TAXI family TRAP transporter solute-binding subunit n=1 Tax=Desulfospira joergensenii TaxID=53329 RepID=UPI0003B39809|nr:TAXI family TRAP transporter solute-binding subunit [Desulfospira joergensenii]